MSIYQDLDSLAARMMPTAAALVIAVDDGDPDTISDLITPLSQIQKNALLVVLAAHVDPDKPMERRAPGANTATREVVRCVAEHFQLPVIAILSDSRRRDITTARKVAYFIARRLGDSTPQIGRVMNRDHSTVLTGCAAVEGNPGLRSVAVRLADELDAARNGLEVPA